MTEDILQSLLQDIKENPSDKSVLGLFDDYVYIEYIKYYSEHIGICIRGSMDKNEEIKTIDYFPIAKSGNLVQVNRLNIFPNTKTSAYFANCREDISGNDILFFLSNSIDYFHQGEQWEQANMSVRFSGFSDSGTIILPIFYDEESDDDETDVDSFSYGYTCKEKLVQNIEEASEMIMERLKTEDFLSVVESYILPQSETDSVYYLLGIIEDCKQIQNDRTGELVWELNVDTTGSPITIFINERDLLGVPDKGMRFMGQTWLQGYVYKREE